LEKSTYISRLYQKYLDNACNLQELQELLQHFEQTAPDPVLSGMIRNELEGLDERYAALPQVRTILSRLDESISTNVMRPKIKRMPLFSGNVLKYWSAAALFLIFSIALYYSNEHLNIFGRYASEYKNDVAPGKDQAYLTLANGKKILLTDSLEGTVAAESGLLISKTAKGQLRYQIARGASGDGYNTISTPRGGHYEVLLADGTLVYLNAASSLRFPVNFAQAAERRVTLDGEGYFEVAHRDAQPFYVQSGKQLLRVLGTHFNLNAYADEAAVKTTLLQGSVSINYPDGKQAVLKPGQQSHIVEGQIRVDQVDAASAIDWQRGEMNLKDEDFQSTMRKIARWYDVEVVFDETAPADLTLGGLVSRDKNLIAVLKVMELTGKVHFKVEGRRVTVMR